MAQSIDHVTPSQERNRSCILRHCKQRKQTLISKMSPEWKIPQAWVPDCRDWLVIKAVYPKGVCTPFYGLWVRGLRGLDVKGWLMILSKNGRKPRWL